jgi:hypothetical protein
MPASVAEGYFKDGHMSLAEIEASLAYAEGFMKKNPGYKPDPTTGLKKLITDITPDKKGGKKSKKSRKNKSRKGKSKKNRRKTNRRRR